MSLLISSLSGFGIEPLDTYLSERLRTSLLPLRSLRLSVSFAGALSDEASAQWLVQLINICPRLERLSLTVDGWVFYSIEEDIHVAYFKDFASSIHLPRLKTLEWQNTTFSTTGLEMLIRRAETTLEAVTLLLVKLSSGDWIRSLRDISKTGLPLLDRIHMAWLHEGGASSFIDENVVCFQLQRMAPCIACDHNDLLRFEWSCGHVSASLRREDVSSLCCPKKLPLAYLEGKHRSGVEAEDFLHARARTKSV